MKKTISILKSILLITLCAALVFSAACQKKKSGDDEPSPAPSDNTGAEVVNPDLADYDYLSVKDEASPELSNDKEVKILVWGDYTVGGNNMSGFLKELAQNGGYNATITSYYYDNSSNGDTYNLYELFDFNGNEVERIKPTGVSQKIKEKIAEGIDFIVITSGRDRTLYNESSAEKTIKAAAELEKLLLASNPGGKMVLAAGPAYVSGFDNLGVTTQKGHLVRINEYAEKMAQSLKTAIIARVGNMFMAAQDYGISPYSEELVNQPSEAGSYLTACVLYSRIFGKAPAGDSESASIDPTLISKLQMITSWYTLGVSPSSSYIYSTPVDPVSEQLEQGTDVNILVWGDYTVGGNSMSEILKTFAAVGGYNANIVTYYYNNYGKNESYDLYELFSFSGDSCTLKNTGTAKKIGERIKGGVDFLVVTAGRDRALYNENIAAKNIKAAAALHQLLTESNPNAKLVVIAGPAYNSGLDAFGVESPVEHLIKINAYTDKLINGLSSALAARVGNAFMVCADKGVSVYDDRDVNMPNVEGSYLTACVLYARIFGCTPATAPVAIEGIPNSTIKTLQLAAEHTAIGIVPLYSETEYINKTEYSEPVYVNPDGQGTDTEPVDDHSSEQDDNNTPEQPDTTDYSSYDYTKVLDEPTPVKAKDKTINIALWGDYTVVGNSMGKMLKYLGDKSGYKLKVTVYGYNNYKSSTYNLYELFKYSDNSTISSFSTGSAPSRLKYKLSSTTEKIDYLVLLSGRDRTLTNVNSSILRTKTAAIYLEKLLKKNNPDGKVVLFAPEPYPEGYGKVTKLFDDTMVNKKHLYKINAFADSLLSVLTDAFAARVGNAFMMAVDKGIPVYDAEYPTQPSLQGSYLSACVLYARLFGVSPVGIEYYSGINEEEAKAIQLVAQESVFGKDYEKVEADSAETAEIITSVEPPMSKEKGLSILTWGDYLLYDSGFSGYMKKIIGEGGYTIEKYTALGYNNSKSTSATYSLYEMFNLDSNGNILSWKTTTSPKTIKSFSGDIFIMVTSRDTGIASENNAQKIIKAYKEVEQQLHKNNPNMKIVFFVPQSPLSGYTTYDSAAQSTYDFNQDINAFADRLADSVPSYRPVFARVGDVFEACLDNGIEGLYNPDNNRFPTQFGVYLSACVTYASIFNDTPIGLSAPDIVSKDVALAAQKIAHKTIFGGDFETAHTGGLNVIAITSKVVKDNGALDTFKTIADTAGFTLNIVNVSGDTDIAGYVSSDAFNNIIKYDLTKFDIVLVEAGRDAVLCDAAEKEKEFKAIKEIEKVVLENNPQAKIVVIAPYARHNTKGYYYNAVLASNEITTYEQYAKLIRTYADELSATLQNSSYVVDLADVFLKATEKGIPVYANSASDLASETGAYAIANTLYARVFKGKPTDVKYYGTVSESVAKDIQQIVNDLVFK